MSFSKVRREIAKQLAKELYNEVGLKGVATWDRRTYRVTDFKIDNIIFLETNNLNDSFKDLSALLGESINRRGDYNTYLS